MARDRGPLRRYRRRRRDDGEREHAARALGGRAARPPRPVAPGRPRASARRARSWRRRRTRRRCRPSSTRARSGTRRAGSPRCTTTLRAARDGRLRGRRRPRVRLACARQLGLSDHLARLIARRIHAVARGRFWRWPAIRLNQFNWYARIYSADAIVTGRSTLVRRDLRRQLARFTARRGGGAGNFGPGMRFHYFPHLSARVRENFDSAEYANIVASFTRFSCARATPRATAVPPVAAAGPVRLLDARRLHELGHRPRIPSLAPEQEARAGPARTDRDRVVA